MTSLFYKIVDGFGEFRTSTGKGAERVRIHIDGADGGILSVGALSAPIKGGVASLSLSPLADGEYSPSLYRAGELIRLESISKCGGIISPEPSGGELLRRLAIRTEALEKRLDTLEERLLRDEGALYGEPLLKMK